MAATFLLVLCVVCFASSLPAAELCLKPATAKHLVVTALDSGWELTTTGNDPYVMLEIDQAEHPSGELLEFEYFCPQPIKPFGLFFGPPFRQEAFLELPVLTQAEGWQRYAIDLAAIGPIGEWKGDQDPNSPSGGVNMIRLDFGNEPGRMLRLRKLQLRPLNAEERHARLQAAARTQAKQQADKAISQYLAQTFPHAIHLVQVSADQVTLTYSWSDQPLPLLREFPPHASIATPESAIVIAGNGDRIETARDQNTVTQTMARFVDGRDRLLSGFALADASGSLISPRKYATKIDAVDPAIPSPPKPRNQKGLSNLGHEGPESDLADLGISAVTANVVLNRYIATQPGPGREAIPVAGEPVYFDHGALVGMDHLMQLARKHKLVVSAIILITNNDAYRPTSPLIHPEVDGGVYAMPDLTTARGSQVYSFVIEKLAERYRDPTSERGGITNWIAHNEVDFHPVWTNCGKQPRTVVTELYYRSMRLIHQAAVRHQPHARVFASLTHHWVVPDDGSWKQLAPREVIESLDRYSELEGDFAWGVAYHPYPESLFAPNAWEDKSPQDHFETPLLTIQNLPVLSRFLHQPQLLDSSGKPRPVLLSEQGFHTADYSEESQRLQAESLRYAMQQVRALPLVESFHYHRWADHPDEGGLKLGLRTLATPEHPKGQKKLAWDAYKDL